MWELIFLEPDAEKNLLYNLIYFTRLKKSNKDLNN